MQRFQEQMFAWVLVKPLTLLFILVCLHVPDYSRIYTFLSCKYHLEHWHIFLEEMQCFHEKNMFAWVLVEPLICLFILVDLHVPDYSRIYTFLSCKYHLEHWHIFLEEMQCFHEKNMFAWVLVEPLICLFILVDLHVPDYSRIYTFLSQVLKGQPPVLLSPIGQFDSE